MKKLTSILLILCLAMSLVCSAAADEVPQPEGGKKFETHWAAQNTVIRIDYEEEGYCVSVVNEIPTEGTGTEFHAHIIISLGSINYFAFNISFPLSSSLSTTQKNRPPVL